MTQKNKKANKYAVLAVIKAPQKLPRNRPELPHNYIEFEEIKGDQAILNQIKPIKSALISIVSNACDIIEAAVARRADRARKRREYNSLRGLSKKEDDYLETFRAKERKVSNNNTTNIYVNGDATFTINN